MTDEEADTEHGVVERDGGAGVIRFRRRFAHPVERVWEAITTPAGLGDWWLPFPARVTVDLRVGGEMSFESLSGEPPKITVRILELAPPNVLVHTHMSPGATMRWVLEADGDGCVLELTHTTDDIDAAIEQHQIVGLHTSLDRLAPALDGSPIEWDWDRFAELERDYDSRRAVDARARER